MNKYEKETSKKAIWRGSLLEDLKSGKEERNF